MSVILHSAGVGIALIVVSVNNNLRLHNFKLSSQTNLIIQVLAVAIAKCQRTRQKFENSTKILNRTIFKHLIFLSASLLYLLVYYDTLSIEGFF